MSNDMAMGDKIIKNLAILFIVINFVNIRQYMQCADIVI